MLGQIEEGEEHLPGTVSHLVLVYVRVRNLAKAISFGGTLNTVGALASWDS